MEDPYFTSLATAFIRGRLGDSGATLQDGVAAGLRLHKFKSNADLPRVQRVLGILRGLNPESLLDIGSGRGTFLWPLLSTFPALPVTAADISPRRVEDLSAVATGGIERLRVVRMDAEHPCFAPGAFDVVTVLEVLEHLRQPQEALTHLVAAARRFVLVSVPSVPDDNPEHLHLFTAAQLEQMAIRAGGSKVTMEHVLNHRVLLIRVDR